MTQGGQEPGDHPPPEQVPFKPVLAESNPKSGRQLAAIMGAMVVFFVVMVILATWAAKNG